MRASLRSRLVRVIAGAAAAALIALAILHSPPIRERALRYVAARAADAGYVVHADAIDYNLFTLSARLSGLSVATSSAVATPFFAAKEASASLSWAVAAGKIALDRVELMSPRVVLRRDQSGRDNWTTGHQREPSGEGPAIHVGRLTVSNMSVEWTDDARSAHADTEVSLDMSSDGRTLAGPIVMVQPANVRWRDHATTIAVAGGRLAWNDRDLAIESVSLKAAEGTLR